VYAVETSGQSPGPTLPAPQTWRWNVVRRGPHPRTGASPAAIRKRTGHPPTSGSSGCTNEQGCCSCGSLPATLGPKLSLGPRRVVDWPYLGWVGLGSPDPITTPRFLKHLSFTPQGYFKWDGQTREEGSGGGGVHVPPGPTRRARWKY
jgi:hypothetical protein